MHGRTIGSISVTCTPSRVKTDTPVLDFPLADFPNTKYPLNQFEAENKIENERVLKQIRDIIQTRRAEDRPVTGIIIEPILAEGGDCAATFDFYRNLRKLALDENIYFIVDEVQTGGGISGKWWAHEHWDLETPPDIVTFAKKMCTGGYYHNDLTRK